MRSGGLEIVYTDINKRTQRWCLLLQATVRTCSNIELIEKLC